MTGYSVAGFVRDSVPSRLVTIRGPEDVAAACGPLRRSQREVFAVLLLNARHEMMRRVTISVGSLNASIVHPRLCAATHKRGYVAAAVMLRSWTKALASLGPPSRDAT
jgi:DNA repair protein RadC